MSRLSAGYAAFPRAATVLLAVAIGVSGCSTAPEKSGPAPLKTASPSPSASASPVAVPTVEPFSIPGCDTLVPLTLARSVLSPNTEFLGESPATGFGGRIELAAIPATVAGSARSTLCRWGIPNSDGLFALVVAEIAPADSAALSAALVAAGFSSVTTGAVTTLERELDADISTVSGTHLLDSDLWVWCDGSGLSVSGPIAASALAAMRVANPSRGF